MLTNRTWILNTLAHREADAVPFNFLFSPPAERALQEYFGAGDLAEQLDLPIRMGAPNSIKPLYADPARYGRTVRDEFGVTWSTNRIDRGSPIEPCLKEADLSGYRFPDPEASYRFEGLTEWCEENRNHYTVVWVGDLWERATFMRGMEPLLVDLAENPRFVQDLLRGLTDYVLSTMEILFRNLSFDAVALSDDYGIQRSMLMSPAAWRRFIKPRLAEIYSYAKGNGRAVFHHSCGNITPIIGDLVDLGLDILHPIQPEAMNILELKRNFGQRLTFCGGLGTQRLLPEGSPEEVRAEVRRLKREMGRGGGYILEPGITIQADVPLANLVALVEEARN